MHLYLSTGNSSMPGHAVIDDDAISVNLKSETNKFSVMFSGNYEERRKFGVTDVFNTLGLTVMEQYITSNNNIVLSYREHHGLIHPQGKRINNTSNNYF